MFKWIKRKCKEAEEWISSNPKATVYISALTCLVTAGVGMEVGYLLEKSRNDYDFEKTYKGGYSFGWNDNEDKHWIKQCHDFGISDYKNEWNCDQDEFCHTKLEDVIARLKDGPEDETFSGILVRDSTVKIGDPIKHYS